MKVRVGDGEETVIGYDTEAAEVFVDRSASGFLPSESFAATHAAPLEVMPDGTVKLHIFVDAASVEVFANDGLRTITDQIFPDPRASGSSCSRKAAMRRARLARRLEARHRR